MVDIKLCELRPFVRYSRYVTTRDYRKLKGEQCAVDCRLFYCVGGNGEFEIDGELYSVESGSLVLIPQGVAYSYHPDLGDPMSFLALNFDYTDSASTLSTPIPPIKKELFKAADIISPVTVTDAVELNKPLLLEKMNSVYPLLRDINDEYERREAWFEVRCSSLLLVLLTRVLLRVGHGSGGRRSEEVSTSLIDYIRENYASRITLANLGERFGYHPNYLNTLFRQHTGKTLYSYLQDHRITEAIHLLQTTDLPVDEIAVKTGFFDASHFSKAFKKKTGFSPVEFRV